MSFDIAAVIVAFNKPDFLEKCIRSIQEQSYPVKNIYIIDNSHDDSVGALIKANYPDCHYTHFPKNIGSEGGFSEGVRQAYSTHDAVWLFDDDCFVHPDACDELVSWMNQIQRTETRVAALRSARPWDISNTEDYREIKDLYAWKGSFILTAAVREIGLPWKELFLYGGDIEYGLRLRSNKMKIFLVYSSHIDSVEYTDELELHFGILKKSIYNSPFRVYYAFRNELCLYIKYFHISRLIRLTLYGLTTFVMASLGGHNKHASAIYHGFKDGLFRKLGKSSRFSPK